MYAAARCGFLVKGVPGRKYGFRRSNIAGTEACCGCEGGWVIRRVLMEARIDKVVTGFAGSRSVYDGRESGGAV